MPSLVKNFLYNSLLTLANLIFPLILFIYVSRIIGPDGLGKVSFISTFSGYFLLFGLFGVGNYGIREIARVKGEAGALRKTFNELFLITCITIGLALLAYAAAFALTSRFKAEPQLYLINGLSILLALFSFDWLFQGLENYRFITIRSILVKTASLSAMFVFVRTKDDYVIYALLSVLGLSANYVFNAIFAWKNIGFTLRGLNLTGHRFSLFRFFLISLATSFYVGLDKIFLGFMSGDYYVGLYAPAEKMARLSLSLVTALSAVLFPRMVNVFAQGDENRSRAMISDSLHAVLLLALPMFVGLELLAGPVIEVLCGNGFLAAVPTLRIESLIIIPVTLANIVGIQILVASGREVKYLLSVIGGAIAFIGIAFLSIPGLKQNGAAIGMVVAETTGAILQLIWARDRLTGVGTAWLWPILGATIVMSVAVAATLLLPLPALAIVIIGTCLGATLYFAMLFLFKDSLAMMAKGKILSWKAGSR